MEPEEINFDDFVTAEKESVGITMSPNIVRLSSGMTLGKDIGAEILGREPQVSDRLIVKIQYNPAKKMLRLSKGSNPSEGYVFSIDQKRRTFSTAQIPSSLKSLKVARGEYEKVPGYDDVFVWVREFQSVLQTSRNKKIKEFDGRTEKTNSPKTQTDPATEFYTEDLEHIEVGDIVAWANRGRTRVISVVTGEVLNILLDSQGVPKLQLKPLNKLYLNNHKSKVVSVRRDKVIIRRKHNEK